MQIFSALIAFFVGLLGPLFNNSVSELPIVTRQPITQQEEPDVKTSFLLELLNEIPKEYFPYYSEAWDTDEYESLASTDRETLVETLDEQNYYMEFKTEVKSGGFARSGEMAVYLRDDGSYFVALYGGPVVSIFDYRELLFIEKKNGVWTDITSEVFPKLDINQLLIDKYGNEVENNPHWATFKLPQHGTTITLVENGELLKEFIYTNGKFEQK
jgi:hypothetical protein